MIRELVVVGAGPCGASAALWGRSLGLDLVVLERDRTAGGQLHQIHFRPGNYVAAADGEGPALGARLAEQLAEAGVEVRYGTAVAAFETADPLAPAVRTEAGQRLATEAVLLATGVRRRPLDVPGEREWEGRGVSYSATQDRERFAGQEVVVVGGGDGAFESALLLAEVGCRVTLVAREAPRARREFRRRVGSEARIEVLERTRVAAIEGDDRVRAVRLEGDRGRFTLEAYAVVIKVGMIPNSECSRGALEHDEEGYVLVDDRLGTSHPRVWAAGDVIRPPLFGLSVAAGQGALAVSAIHGVLRGE